MQAPKEASEITPGGRACDERIFLKGREGLGLVGSATSPTVDDYATTGVSGQQNVLFLF
jgi:hypothetical protein